jgi:hypothetical protein
MVADGGPARSSGDRIGGVVCDHVVLVPATSVDVDVRVLVVSTAYATHAVSAA